jgi:hypothetical protein
LQAEAGAEEAADGDDGAGYEDSTPAAVLMIPLLSGAAGVGCYGFWACRSN